MKNKGFILMLLGLVCQSSYAESGSLEGVLTSILQKIDQISVTQTKQFKTYISQCGNETNKKYSDAGWASVEECLTDGRVHLVYQVDERNGGSLGDFNDSDLQILIKAIKRGADISVTEHSKHQNGLEINYKCASASTVNGLGVCSSAPFYWPSNTPASKKSSILFKTSTDGKRVYTQEYHTVLNGLVDQNTGVMSADIGKGIENLAGSSNTWIKSYSWFIRY